MRRTDLHHRVTSSTCHFCVVLFCFAAKYATAARTIAFLSKRLQEEQESVLKTQVQVRNLQKQLSAQKVKARSDSHGPTSTEDNNNNQIQGNVSDVDVAYDVDSLAPHLQPRTPSLDVQTHEVAPPTVQGARHSSSMTVTAKEDLLLHNADLSPRFCPRSLHVLLHSA